MGSSDEGKRIERAARLAEKQRELLAQLHDVTEELRKILAGETATGDLLKRLSRFWCERWATRYLGKYAWEGAKDTSAAKRLIRDVPIAEIERRIAAFIADPDPFYRDRRHPFTIFAMNINRYAPLLSGDEPSALDCRHLPPCRTDAEHTKRSQAELRA
jgi:hypothetical protein